MPFTFSHFLFVSDSLMKKSLLKMASGMTEKGARARANVQTRIDRIKEKNADRRVGEYLRALS